MNPVVVVVVHVIANEPSEMLFVQRDDMVENLAAAASYPAFRGSVLPRCLYTRAAGSTDNDNGWTLADRSLTNAHLDTGYRVRIIEVQRPKPWDGKTALWNELFADSGASDAAARIVRISEPIDSVPGSFGVCEGN